MKKLEIKLAARRIERICAKQTESVCMNYNPNKAVREPLLVQ